MTTKPPKTEPLPRSLSPDFLLKSLGIIRPEDIDIEAIAYYAGLRVKRRELKSCEAMITGKGNKGIISVRPDTMPARQRFSIAHELGHWAHHRGTSVACRATDIGSFSKFNEVERAADYYAANLLMPWPIFKDACKGHKRLDLKSVRNVADLFECSLTATLFRMIDSGEYPNALAICHHPTGRKWFRASTEIPRFWFPKNELDADSFAFDLLHNANTQDQAFPRKLGADAWFDNPQAERYEITEQSFRIPNDCVITILLLDERMVF